MTIIEFITENLPLDIHPLVTSVALSIIFLVVYDFYHLLISSVLTWFKK